LIRDHDPAEGIEALATGQASAINDEAECISKRRYWSIIACPGHHQSLTPWPLTSTDLEADLLSFCDAYTSTDRRRSSALLYSSLTELFVWYSNFLIS